MAYDFKQYLAEAVKQYDFKVKIAGECTKEHCDKIKTAMAKYEVANFKGPKSTPIQEVPLDFPTLKNEQVNIFDVTVNYPTTPQELRSYLANTLKKSEALVVVRNAGEPLEQYQEITTDDKPYEPKLSDAEYKDAPKINAEEHYGDKYNMSLLKELTKMKQEQEKEQPSVQFEQTPEVEQKTQANEEDPKSESPIDGK